MPRHRPADVIDALLLHVRPAVLRVLIMAVFVLSASGLYLYGFKGAFKQRGELRDTVAALADKPEPARIQRELDEVREQAAARAQRLRAATAAQDAGQLNTELMAGLEACASRHHVHLLRVVPGALSTTQGFAELPFQVEASGAYLELYAWLREVEALFEHLPIATVHIEAGESADLRVLRMTMVSHSLNDGNAT